MLLAHGAKTEARVPLEQTALMGASEMGHYEIVRLLLAHGANVHAKDYAGQSAVNAAELNGHPAIARLLKRARSTAFPSTGRSASMRRGTRR